MRRPGIFRKIILFLVLTICFMGLTSIKAKAEPVIRLLQTPKLGEQAVLSGKVVQEDGSPCDSLTGYRIIFYIQVNDGELYYVKPGIKVNGVFETIEIQSDGTFFGNAFSYGEKNDLIARYIHVLLVPSSFIPKETNYTEALSVSKDYITITRETNGTISISPQRFFHATTEARKKTGLSVSESKLALDVDFYTTGKQGRTLSESEIKKHLKAIQPFTDTVRFYSASDTTSARAYKIANQLGLKIIASCWISGDPVKDQQEMDALIEYAKKGWVSMCCVGSECIYSKTVSVDQLIKDMEYVRERIPGNIPVTTAEILGIVLGNARLRNACDVLFVNSYPIYEGVSIENAASHLAAQIAALQAIAPNTEIIISETGHATQGSSAANEKNAVKYFEDVRKWSVSREILTVFFMSADARWKSVQDSFGPHWGFLTNDLKLKSCYADTAFFKQYASKDSKKTTGKKRTNNSITKVTANKRIKYSTVKRKKVTFKISAKGKGNAKLTFRLLNKKKYIKISKNGTVTLKKGTKKGTYKIKVQITAAETTDYYKTSAIKTIKVIVK